jgi:hypothetical protein
MKTILRVLSTILILGAAATVTTTARVAAADPSNPTDSDRAAARPFALEGLRLVQGGNCRDAVGHLEKAEALVHAPTTAVPLAQCDIQLGKIIAGTEILNRVLNETLAPNAPPSFAEAKRQARTILDAAAPRVAKLRIHVESPGGVPPNLQVTVDGENVPLVLLDNDRPTDPGLHKVVAQQPGGAHAEIDVQLAEGQATPVTLRLAGVGGAPVGAAASGAVPDPYGQGYVTPPPGAPPAGAGAPAPVGTELMPGAPWMAFEFGVRFAFGIPLGSAQGGNGNDLSQSISNQIAPLWLDAGIRFLSNWYVGTYVSYGIASISNQAFQGLCNTTGVGCSGNDIRLGIDAAYHFLPDGRVDPWLGLGFGFEWLSGTLTADAAHTNTGTAITANSGLSGWEFVQVQGGVDFRLLQGALGIGPFVTLAVDQYSHQSAPSDNNGGTTGSNIQNQAFHEWVLFGAKGTYDVKF